MGRTIVWVLMPPQCSRGAWLDQAEEMFDNAWAAIPAVLFAVEQQCRGVMPEVWKSHDNAGGAGAVLAVRGIWLDPSTGATDYEVGPNDAIDGLPELLDGYSIVATRDSCGLIRIRQ